jgi:hypothetical protein
MTASTITVEGFLQPDGLTVRVEERLSLPPGRVTVTLRVPAAPVEPPPEEANSEGAGPPLEWRWNKGRRKIRAAVKEYSGQTHADY